MDAILLTDIMIFTKTWLLKAFPCLVKLPKDGSTIYSGRKKSESFLKIYLKILIFFLKLCISWLIENRLMELLRLKLKMVARNYSMVTCVKSFSMKLWLNFWNNLDVFSITSDRNFCCKVKNLFKRWVLSQIGKITVLTI